MTNEPKILLKTKRQGFDDSIFWGSYFLADRNSILKQYGQNEDTICFMRSLAKPLQTCILCDYVLVNEFSSQELAIVCASHAGSPRHISVLKNLMARYKIKYSDLELVALEPLDTRHFSGKKTKLHNNCSAKHILMVILSKYLGYSAKNYVNENHPIQKLIKKRQDELSGYNSDILTYDGCSTPLWGLPYKNVIKAYFNFFESVKYKKLIQAIINNPYIYGGFNRFDSEIIKTGNKNLFAKVGAGGLVLIYNFKEDKILLVKMAQDNNEARKLITLDILNKLNWINKEPSIYQTNQKGQNVAKYCYEFNI